MSDSDSEIYAIELGHGLDLISDIEVLPELDPFTDSDDIPALESDDNDIPKIYTDIKYTTDGLDEKEYKVSYIKQHEKKVIRCECCYKYFLARDYAHTTNYGLKVQDIIACIHCYFSFNITKYVDNIELTLNDKKCIKYYIDNFTSQHNTVKCDRMKSYNICLLCNSKKDIIPSYIMSDKIVYGKNTKNNFNRKAFVIKSYDESFVLSL